MSYLNTTILPIKRQCVSSQDVLDHYNEWNEQNKIQRQCVTASDVLDHYNEWSSIQRKSVSSQDVLDHYNEWIGQNSIQRQSVSKQDVLDHYYSLIEARKNALLERIEEEMMPKKEEPIVKARPKFTKKVNDVNLTEQWIFHPAHNRFEKLQIELTKNLKNATYFKIAVADHVDRVRDFMVWMVEVDHLRPVLEKENTIKVGAIWHHFTQWLIRLGHKAGKDALSREKEGARTQAQLMKRSLGIEQVFEAKVVAKEIKDETGEVLDMFNEEEEDFDLSIREKYLNEKVLECLKMKFPDGYEFYNQLYLDKLYQTYPSVTVWSKSIGIPERQLRFHLEKMTKKLQSFGKNLFLS